jgi:hypothetical protein
VGVVLEVILKTILALLLGVSVLAVIAGLFVVGRKIWVSNYETIRLTREAFAEDGTLKEQLPETVFYKLLLIAPDLGEVRIGSDLSVDSLVVQRGTTLVVEGSLLTRTGEVHGHGRVVAKKGIRTNY